MPKSVSPENFMPKSWSPKTCLIPGVWTFLCPSPRGKVDKSLHVYVSRCLNLEITPFLWQFSRVDHWLRWGVELHINLHAFCFSLIGCPTIFLQYFPAWEQPNKHWTQTIQTAIFLKFVYLHLSKGFVFSNEWKSDENEMFRTSHIITKLFHQMLTAAAAASGTFYHEEVAPNKMLLLL